MKPELVRNYHFLNLVRSIDLHKLYAKIEYYTAILRKDRLIEYYKDRILYKVARNYKISEFLPSPKTAPGVCFPNVFRTECVLVLDR